MVFRKLYFALFALLVFSAGCVKEDFDVPPIGSLPELTPNATIEQLKSLHTLGRAATQVTEDWVIDAVVAGDDQAGNLFRQIAVQDETGGIILRLNATDLYTIYPEGSTVFIRAKDLYVGDFNGLYQVNGSPEDPIEELLIPKFVVPSNEPAGDVEATVLTIADLQSDATLNRYQGSLIQLNDVQFVAADTEVPYADAVQRFSLNRTLEDCNENEIIVRTSGFADFASDLTPAGNGTLTGILTVFGSTRQITLRNPDYDVLLTGERCGGGTGGGDLISLAELRTAFAGGATSVPDARSVRGVVISDVDNGNITGRNLVLQDGDAGIVIRFTGNHGFALGQELEIAVGGLELSEFNGLLQINEVPNGSAVSQGAGTLPTPRQATVAQVLENVEAWESTLVELSDVMFNGGATYNGSVDVSDASGTIPMFTRGAATFSESPLPSGELTLTAIVSDFNGPQVFIRNLDDVDGGMIGGGGDPEAITALELRSLFNGGAGSVTPDRFIRAVVISDASSGNITGRNMVIQDASGGIVIRFADNHNFALGEEVEINVGGLELSEFNGLLQVNNVPNGNAMSLGNGTLPEPRVATIQQIIDNQDAWESTLVTIESATISGSGTYSGGTTVTDASGSIDMFTRNDASFADSALPSGAVDLTAIVSEFNDPQINIRNLSDVVE